MWGVCPYFIGSRTPQEYDGVIIEEDSFQFPLLYLRSKYCIMILYKLETDLHKDVALVVMAIG